MWNIHWTNKYLELNWIKQGSYLNRQKQLKATDSWKTSDIMKATKRPHRSTKLIPHLLGPEIKSPSEYVVKKNLETAFAVLRTSWLCLGCSGIFRRLIFDSHILLAVCWSWLLLAVGFIWSNWNILFTHVPHRVYIVEAVADSIEDGCDRNHPELWEGQGPTDFPKHPRVLKIL